MLGLLSLLAAFVSQVPAAPRKAAGEGLFTDGKIRTFKITVDEPGLVLLNKDDRGYVRATVAEGTNVLRDVGMHLKGMGSFRPFREKASFALKFDKYAPEQSYLGLTKFMLNNSSQDPTFLAEMLATQMFREAGVPAARVTHAFVEINGRQLGLYVLIEAMNKEFLKLHFKNTRGNLYEAYLQDIDQKLDQDGGGDNTQADLKKLLEVAKLPVPLERWDRLPEVFDVDRYLSHLAVEMFTSHTDGYAMNRNNYRIYHDPSSGRFVMIAHGIDWAFSNTGVPIQPPRNSILTKAVLETPAGRKQYKQRVALLFTNVFNLEVQTNRVNLAVARLKAAARNPGEAKEFENYGSEMHNRLVARHKNIVAQLAAPEPQPIKFDAQGIALLTGWQSKKDKGEPVFDQPKLGDKGTLHVRADKGDIMGSWRAAVLLDAGKYRFEGRAMVTNVVALTNEVKLANGAGLRISGGKRAAPLTGSTGWTALEHEFEVMEGGEDKTFVCELRAMQGEVWFDTASLRLVRIK